MWFDIDGTMILYKFCSMFIYPFFLWIILYFFLLFPYFNVFFFFSFFYF